jgi:hypothetical protein
MNRAESVRLAPACENGDPHMMVIILPPIHLWMYSQVFACLGWQGQAR